MTLMSSMFGLSILTKTSKSIGQTISRLYYSCDKEPSKYFSKKILAPFMHLPEHNNTSAGSQILDLPFKIENNTVSHKSLYLSNYSFALSFYNPLNTHTSIEEPLQNVISNIKEPIDNVSQLNTLPKSDIIWRRRRMRRHKLLRWRAKYPQIVKAREEKKLANRKEKHEERLEKSWEMFGLNSKPPKLSDEEKSAMVQQWRQEGIWTEALTLEEYLNLQKITDIMKKTDKK